MTEGKFDRPFRPRPVAPPEAFIRERTRPAKFDEERTRLACIYAIYRRWAFLSDKTATTLQKFEAALAKECKCEPFEFRGHRIYPRWVLDPPEPVEDELDDRPDKVVEPKQLGLVRVVQPLEFVGEQCEVGEVLPWMDPTMKEKDSIERLSSASSMSKAKSHLVVVWRGKRRVIAGTKVERVRR